MAEKVLGQAEKTEARKRPYFIWNADLTDADVREILAGHRGELEQAQMIAHIMQNARFEDIWKYIKPADIAAHWELVGRMLWPRESRELWGWALSTWGYNVRRP